jgi:hypothetical protein
MPSSAALFIRRLQPSKCRPSTLARIQIERPAAHHVADWLETSPAGKLDCGPPCVTDSKAEQAAAGTMAQFIHGDRSAGWTPRFESMAGAFANAEWPPTKMERWKRKTFLG